MSNPPTYSPEWRSSLREAMLNAVSDMVFVFSSEGKMLEWNKRTSEISGYSDQEIAGMHPTDFLVPTERNRFTDATDRVASREEVSIETQLQTKDNRRYPFHLHVSSVMLDRQPVICAVGHSLSEPKQSDEALRHIERRYHRLFEKSPAAIAATTPRGTVIDINSACCELFGYSREEMLNTRPEQWYADPEDRKKITKLLENENLVHNYEVPIRRRDGQERIALLSIIPRFGEEGNVDAYYTFARDVTKRKRALSEVRESEAKFRALTENSTIGILLIQKGYLRYVNKAFADMYGYRPEELIDTIPFIELVHPDDRARVSHNIDRRLKGDTDSMVYRYRGLTKEGKTIRLEAYGTRMEYQGYPAIIGTDMNITDRLRLQRELLRIQEEERRRIGQDLHDGVGTQLSGISLLLSALEHELTDDRPDLAEKLQQIRAYVQEADRNTKAISTGLNPVPLEKDGLAAALERLASSVGTSADVSCNMDCHQDISRLPSEVASHLYWIIQEATTNARKYAEADTLSINLTCSETALKLVVEDDGNGFELPDNQGMGLGLRTMIYRAELLGGRLAIDSAPGKGTSIRCNLPLD